MKKSFLVIGLGRFGIGIVRTLVNLRSDITAIDVDEDAFNRAAEFISNCAICDSTKLSALKALGVNNISDAVVAIGGNLEASILTVINLHELGIKNIIVRIDDSNYKSVMERLGATDVVIPEEASAISLAHQIISDSVLDYYKIDKDYGVVKILVADTFEATELVKLDLRNKYDINIVGIIRNGVFNIPKGTDLLCPNDLVLVIGKTSKISRFEKAIND